MKRAGFALLLLLLLTPELALLGFITVGAVLASAASVPTRADAVVVLGGDNGARYARARELMLAGYAQQMVLIDPSESDTRDALARFPCCVVVWNDVLPANSWGEAQVARARMQANGWHSVLVVSDPPHMLRVRYAWASNFWGSGLTYTLVASSPQWWSTWRWWQNPVAVKFVESEVAKLGYYVLRYRFGFF